MKAGVDWKHPEYHKIWREVNKDTLKQKRLAKYLSFWKPRRLRRAYWINKYKQAKGCQLCGYNLNTFALDFDHLQPKGKSFNISHRLDRSSLKSLFIEIRKCRVLCANCHRIETHKGDYI